MYTVTLNSPDMAAYQMAYTFRGNPLYFFYDCEATGRDAETDRIIEIGAVLCTYNLSPRTSQALQQDHQFTSLCYCIHPIDPEAAKILTITLKDLKDAPKLEVVLKQFCDWIKERVTVAERSDLCTYTPVLVAHSGNLLDYPLLFSEIRRTGSYTLNRKFEDLNLHYTDSHFAIRQLARSNLFFRSFPGLGVKDLHQGLLHVPYIGHRALPDAQALHKIFTQCQRVQLQTELFRELRKFTQSKQGVEFIREQVPKFLEAHIKPAKAEELLMRGITYDKVLREYQLSPHNFEQYLRSTCGITRPKQELLDHFKEKW